MPKNSTAKAAAQELQLRDSYNASQESHIWDNRQVLEWSWVEFVQRNKVELQINQFSRGGPGLIVVLTFLSRWDICQFRSHPSCRDKFACLRGPLWSCQSHGCNCWSCKSKVPQLLFQAVLALWPFLAQITYSKDGTLATLLQMYRKQCHELPWSEKETVCSTWCCLIFGWNSSFASFTIQRPERYRCSVSRFFADWTNGTTSLCAFP